MKKVLCTFGNTLLSPGFPRFVKNAGAMGVFDKIYSYTEKDLPREFRKKWGRYMYPYSKGYGYWCWKPPLIKKTLDTMEDGDILLYVDVGCYLNLNGKERLAEYYDIVEKSPSGILGFRSFEVNYNGMPEGLRFEYEWTKGDIFDYFGVRDNKNITQTTQYEAGIIFMKKGPVSAAFVDEWLKVIDDDFSLITDDPSRSPDLPGFKENRHDQSIYSMLAKKYKIDAVSTNELIPLGGVVDWSVIDKYPIQARREVYYKSMRHYNRRFQLRKLYAAWWKFKYFFKDIFRV
ncbi:MAG: hypothetical protein LBL79_11480 [Prevotella sp.]|jgi:hypothetical protein|nr:hypothetical protein [Prevotella sp.]